MGNTTFQTAIEGSHNAILDNIRKKQDKIMSYTASMESIKELYRMSMQKHRWIWRRVCLL